jgi:hypothetical protein
MPSSVPTHTSGILCLPPHHHCTVPPHLLLPQANQQANCNLQHAGVIKHLLLLEALQQPYSSTSQPLHLLAQQLQLAFAQQHWHNMCHLTGAQPATAPGDIAVTGSSALVKSSKSISSGGISSDGVEGVAKLASSSSSSSTLPDLSAWQLELQLLLHSMSDSKQQQLLLHWMQQHPATSTAAAAASGVAQGNTAALPSLSRVAAASATSNGSGTATSTADVDADQRYLASCFGWASCTSLCCWVLLWHAHMAEQEYDYSCVRDRRALARTAGG